MTVVLLLLYITIFGVKEHIVANTRQTRYSPCAFVWFRTGTTQYGDELGVFMTRAPSRAWTQNGLSTHIDSQGQCAAEISGRIIGTRALLHLQLRQVLVVLVRGSSGLLVLARFILLFSSRARV